MFGIDKYLSVYFLLKVLRYGGGSLLAVGADVGLMWLLASVANTPYLIAAGTGFTVGCVVKYLVSKYLVYEDNRGNDKALSIVVFISIALCGLALNQFVIYVGVEYLGAHLFLAKLFSAGLVFVMNFFLLGLLVFKDPLVKEKS